MAAVERRQNAGERSGESSDAVGRDRQAEGGEARGIPFVAAEAARVQTSRAATRPWPWAAPPTARQPFAPPPRRRARPPARMTPSVAGGSGMTGGSGAWV